MKNTRKGFTLVELLAVIVILAIIMIIAIPAVLQTMNMARQKTFREYLTKVYTAAQTYNVAQAIADTSGKKGAAAKVGNGDETCYVYDVAKIGLSSVGEYKGTVIICENANSVNANSNVYIGLQDANYTTGGIYSYSDNGEMEKIQTSVSAPGANITQTENVLVKSDGSGLKDFTGSLTFSSLISAAKARSDIKNS